MSANITIHFTGHNFEVTEPMREYATKRFEKLFRHFDHILGVDVTFKVEKLSQIVKGHIKTAGKTFHADVETENMYESIDILVDKLDRQLVEHRKQEIAH